MTQTALNQPEALSSVELEMEMDRVFVTEFDSCATRYYQWRELFGEFQRRLDAAKREKYHLEAEEAIEA